MTSDIQMLILGHLLINQTDHFLSPREDAFIILAPQAGARHARLGMAPTKVHLDVAILGVSRLLNKQGKKVLFEHNIFSTSFWAIERATASADTSLPMFPAYLRLDLIKAFETTLVVMPGYLTQYHDSLFNIARGIACMVSLKVLRLAVAEYQAPDATSDSGDGRRIHGWDTCFIKFIKLIASAVPRDAQVHVMDGEESCVGIPGICVVDKSIVEAIVHGGATQASNQMLELE